MKKILFLNLLFLNTIALEPGPAETFEWSISYSDLKKSLHEKSNPLSMTNLLLRKYNICEIINLPGYENSADDLKELIAKQWYKKNAQRINNWILKEVPTTTLSGHSGTISSIAILPNGDIVTGSDDNTANIW